MPEGAACTIILVRHGETEANRLKCFAASDDIELTDVGRQQAHEQGRAIRARFHPARVYSSEFTRALQTAEIVARELGLTVEVLPGIHERDFGSLRGAPYHEMGALMRSDRDYDAAKRWLWTPPGGESLDAVQRRALAALQAVGANCGGEAVVVVSHGAVMEAVSAALSGDWGMASVPQNCEMLVIEYGEDGFRQASGASA